MEIILQFCKCECERAEAYEIVLTMQSMWRRQFDIGICILTTVWKYRNTLRIIKINKQRQQQKKTPTSTNKYRERRKTGETESTIM